MKSKQQIYIILFSFIVIVFLSIASKIFGFYQIERMHSITNDIYDHPLQVSNAALNIKMQIYKIHRDMKDIVLSSAQQERDHIIEEISQHEQSVYNNLTIIEKNILGEEGLRLEKNMKALFEAWKPIRDDVIMLMNSGKTDEAISITKGKGAQHVLALESASQTLYAYAQNKATGFIEASDRSFEELKFINYEMSTIFLLLFASIIYFTIKKLSSIIERKEHLAGVLAVMRDVKQLIVREKEPKVLLQKSCDLLISNHVFGDAWISILDDNNDIEYIFGSDKSDFFTAFQENVRARWIPHCMDKTINSDTNYSFILDTTSHCKKCPLADTYGCKSAFNITLEYDKKIYGYLNISVGAKSLQSIEELALLEEVANDIAYALYNINVEQSIMQLKELYDHTINSVENLIFVKDMNFTFIACNSAFEKLIGRSKDEIIGKNDYDLFSKEDADFFRKHDKEMLLTKYSKSNNEWVIYPDGREAYLFTTKSPLTDSKGDIIGLVGNSVDMTEHNHLYELFQEAQSIAKIGNWEHDLEADVITASDETLRICGLLDSNIKLDKHTFISLCHPDDLADYHQAILDSINSKEITIFQNRIIRHGEVRYLEHHWVTKYKNEKAIKTIGTTQDITQDKRQEEALLLINKRFELAERIGNIGSWEYNIQTQEIWGSDQSKVIYGLPRESSNYTIELIENCIPERERVHQALVDLLEKGAEYNLEFEINPLDGSPSKIISSLAEVQRDDEGSVIKVVGSIQDITARKNAEKELHISNHKFEKAFNQTPNIIVVSNLNTGKIYDINQTFEKIFGFKKAEVIGKTTFDIDLWHDLEDRKKYIDTFKKYGVINGDIYKFNTKNRSLITATVFASLITIENEAYILAVAEDITEKQENLRLLQQKKQELETIIQDAPNPIMIHNEKGEVILINKVWEELTGYSYSDIDTIEKWIQKAYGEEISDIKEYIEKLYAIHHKINEGEYKIKTKNGDTLIWQFSSAPLEHTEGIRTVISAAMDITELKKKDELMILQSRQAAMGEMIGMIAHQWRQPLTVISMNANNMLLDIALDESKIEETEAAAQNILLQTQHLSKTIDDFRNFFKPDRETSKIKVPAILDETYAIVKDSLINNNIEYTHTYESDTQLNAYPRELMQVFVNIINNAKDSLVTKASDNRLIGVRVYDDGDYVTTEICDNGRGIDAAIMPKIFDPYFTTKDDITGTGLGLYMSKMIIENHLHGKIEVFNNKEGACFKVKLLKS